MCLPGKFKSLYQKTYVCKTEQIPEETASTLGWIMLLGDVMSKFPPAQKEVWDSNTLGGHSRS